MTLKHLYIKLRYSIIFLFFLIIFIMGCCISIMPIKQWADIAVGKSIYDLIALATPYEKKVGWREYSIPNGNRVFVQPMRKNCEIHWEVDKDGFILRYTFHGSGCK
ncbi:hypothetical protein TRIP_B40248 [uncultured Desulfatiglans sp.]|uniref:Lipoprotein n=1 Tax=Uncultured Desulfatiglans sp. TaxID=1748965 RepID=A0A653AE72_UNCDX|nr:hypothetical protein TRIP_B40248 [uncultured Desulfatiglans sp.]